MIIGFIVCIIVAVIFFCISFSCRKSDSAIGFFTFVKPPIINDIKSYNNAVSILWIVTAILFVIIGIPFLFLEQNSLLFIPIIFVIIIWLISLMIAYLKIEAKYKK